MTNASSHAVRAAVLGLWAAVPCSSGAEPTTSELDLLVPTIVAFMPTAVSEGESSLEQALDLAQACFGSGAFAYRLVHADRIVVHDGGGHDAVFELGGRVPLPGALFLAPGANPGIVYAGGGVAAMASLLPRAAGEYFHIPCA